MDALSQKKAETLLTNVDVPFLDQGKETYENNLRKYTVHCFTGKKIIRNV
jgi:hypothetical protein